VLNSLNKICIFTSEYNAGLGEDILVNDVTVEILFLAFLKLLLFFFNGLAIFVHLCFILHETMLGIVVSAGITVKDITTVTAGVLNQLLL
jgi:hypothetical protein